MKKKLLSLLLTVCTALSIFSGCSSRAERVEKIEKDDTVAKLETVTSMNIACMKGPTGIGMIKLIADSDEGKTANTYNYSIVGTADEIATKLLKGELDIAAVPCNLASVLYNKSEGEILTLGINTLGVLYIVEAGDSITSVNDLKGKTIYSTGQGTTPEYTLRFLLSSAGLDPDKDVDIQFKSEAPEVLAALKQDTTAVAMLPQPYATVALNSDENMRIALDVTKEWESFTDATVVTGVLVARKTFIEENKDALASFMKEYEASTTYANTNVDDTAALLEKYDVFKAAIAKKAIPYCNVTLITGEDMKTKAMSYLNVLLNENPASIGGKLQEGMFYLENK